MQVFAPVVAPVSQTTVPLVGSVTIRVTFTSTSSGAGTVAVVGSAGAMATAGASGLGGAMALGAVLGLVAAFGCVGWLGVRSRRDRERRRGSRY